jgi:hypothetical protein
MWHHCTCTEVCLPSHCLEAGCITPLFHCCVYYLEMAVSVAQPFLHEANTPQYKKSVYTSHYFLKIEMGDFGLLLLVSCLTYSLTPNVETVCSSIGRCPVSFLTGSLYSPSDSWLTNHCIIQRCLTHSKLQCYNPQDHILQAISVLNWHCWTHENILPLQSQWKFQVSYDLVNVGQQCKLMKYGLNYNATSSCVLDYVVSNQAVCDTYNSL